jgi:KAP-like P-loop domain-containing protein
MEGKARIIRSPLNAELHAASLADLPSVDDRVGFAPYVQALQRFLTNEQTHGPLTISIEGEWGIGKSSFMKQLEAALRAHGGQDTVEQPIIVWFNAWRHDRADELWASFALEFMQQVTRQLTCRQRYKGHTTLFYLRFKWGKGWPDVARAIIWIGIGGYLLAGALQGLAWINSQVTRWIALGGIVAGAVGAVTRAVGWIAEKIGNPLKIDLKQHAKSPDYEQRTAFIEQFHQDFAKILKAYVGNRRVFVFVDDLDRCEIPKAAELMQALNLMLSNDNELFFVLGMDRRKVAAGIALKHSSLLPYLRAGELEDAGRNTNLEWYGLLFGYEFIEKFIQVPFVIPQPTEDGVRDYIHSLSNADIQPSGPKVPPKVEERRDMFRLKVTHRDSEEILRIVERVAPALENNPRRLKLFLNLFRLRLLTAVETGLLDEGGGLTVNERLGMNLGVGLLPGQEALTLEQLGTFVALSLRWPLLLAEAVNDPRLIERLEDTHVTPVSDRWRSEPQLLEFLRGNQEGRLGEVDIRRLLRALPQVRAVGRTFQIEMDASTAPMDASLTAGPSFQERLVPPGSAEGKSPSAPKKKK